MGTTVAGESVRLSWESVEDADSYSLTLAQAQGAEQEGLCPDTHTISQSVGSTSASISIVGSTETGVLRAYTTYVVTVRAVSGARGTSGESQSKTVLTPQTSEDPILGNCAL